jgi:hypothetical protein
MTKVFASLFFGQKLLRSTPAPFSLPPLKLRRAGWEASTPFEVDIVDVD